MELQQSADQQSQHSSSIEWAVGRRDKPNGPHKGLLPMVKTSPGGIVAALIDVPDVGEAAMELAKEAGAVVDDYTHQTLIDLFAKCDRRCNGTQGVSMSAVQVKTGFATISWYGVGTVSGTLFRRSPAADPRIFRLDRDPEMLGVGKCMLREYCVPIKPGDVIILATDGIMENFVEALPIDGKPRLVADQLLAKYCKEDTDCAMVVVRFLGAPSAS